jgi:2-polyprenyl-3-methyl-5-hydroxy-6-metoxy-1,4-benzoquinol methylase
MTRLIRSHYDRSYQDVAARLPETCYKWTLENWEEDVLACHKMTSGTILVLGAGVGRESIVLAQRGFLVVGLDINRESLCVASQQAMAKGLRLLFAQADFLAIPIGLAQVDYVFMSGIMYSSIPGRQQRQAWLRSLRTCMNEQGLVVLNFLIAREMETRTHRFVHRLNRWLTTLPGANQSYQLGDTCSHSHFLHAFVDEEEIRSELRDAGATIDHLRWHDGCAVLSWPSR